MFKFDYIFNILCTLTKGALSIIYAVSVDESKLIAQTNRHMKETKIKISLNCVPILLSLLRLIPDV